MKEKQVSSENEKKKRKERSLKAGACSVRKNKKAEDEGPYFVGCWNA